jgi:alpha-glucosidase
VPSSHINVHIRPGTVLALYKNPGYTIFETAQSPYTLLVSLNDAGQAHGEMYYDDGETQWTDKAPGTTVTFDISDGKLTTNVIHGAYSIPQRLTDIVVLGVSQKPSNVYSNIVPIPHSYDSAVRVLHRAFVSAMRWTDCLTLNQKMVLNAASLAIDLNKPFLFSWI